MKAVHRVALTIIFAAALFSSVGANAGDWRQISPNPSSTPVSVDIDSLRWNGDLATFSADLMAGPVAGSGIGGQSSIYLVQIACTTKQIRLSASGSLNSGNPLAPSDLSPYTFQPVRGLVADVMRRTVCPLNPAVAEARIAAQAALADDPVAEMRRQPAWRPPAFEPNPQ